MGAGGDYVRKVAREAAIANLNILLNSTQQPPSFFNIGCLTADQKQVQLPDGSLYNVVMAGKCSGACNPVIRMTPDTFYMPCPNIDIKQSDGGGSPNQYNVYVQNRFLATEKFYIQDISSSTLYYLPVTENGINLAAVAPVFLTQVLFSTNGKDIAFAYLDNTFGSNQATAHWIVFSGFSLNKNTLTVDSHAVVGSLPINISAISTVTPSDPSAGFASGGETQTFVQAPPIAGGVNGTLTHDFNYTDYTATITGNPTFQNCTVLGGVNQLWDGATARTVTFSGFFGFNYNSLLKRSSLDLLGGFSVSANRYFLYGLTSNITNSDETTAQQVDCGGGVFMFDFVEVVSTDNITLSHTVISCTQQTVVQSFVTTTNTTDPGAACPGGIIYAVCHPCTPGGSSGSSSATVGWYNAANFSTNPAQGFSIGTEINAVKNSATGEGLYSVVDLAGSQTIDNIVTQTTTGPNQSWVTDPTTNTVGVPATGQTTTIGFGTKLVNGSSTSSGTVYGVNAQHPTPSAQDMSTAYTSFAGNSAANLSGTSPSLWVRPYLNIPGVSFGSSQLLLYSDTHAFTVIPTSVKPAGSQYYKAMDSETVCIYGITPGNPSQNFINKYKFSVPVNDYVLVSPASGVTVASSYLLCDWTTTA